MMTDARLARHFQEQAAERAKRYAEKVIAELAVWMAHLTPTTWVQKTPCDDQGCAVERKDHFGEMYFLSSEATDALRTTLTGRDDGYTGQDPVVVWNDLPTTTLSDVHDIFEQTIIRLGALI